jgi:D-amino-acid oxidase
MNAGGSDAGVTVVGAGIIGLTAAWRLAEAGHDVRVLAAAPPGETTSVVAAAIWYPYLALPQDLVTRWSAVGFRELAGLAAQPGTGVRVRWGRQLFREPTPDPWWRTAVPDLQRVPAAELPPPYMDGYRLRVPAVDMPRHLAWLADRLAGHGVRTELRRLSTLDEAPGGVVVDCTGLGARDLLGDRNVVPVRGQVVVVEQFGLEEWLLDETEELTYVAPREETIVLGGTSQRGADDLTPDPQTAWEILARCAALVPQVARARIVEHRVGLRPARTAVRLERDVLGDGRPVVHCYGHGGSGVTMSYGCARDVVALVADALA